MNERPIFGAPDVEIDAESVGIAVVHLVGFILVLAAVIFIDTYLVMPAFAMDASYAITDLGTFGGAYSEAMDINEKGQVVGYATRPDGYGHAFLYSDGQMVDLGDLGYSDSHASAINNDGEIVGWSIADGQGYSHAFIYKNGQLHDINPVLGDPPFAASSSLALDINDASQIALCVGASGYSMAMLYSNGYVYDLGNIESYGYWDDGAGSINNAGQLIGDAIHHYSGRPLAFIYSNGLMKELGTLEGGNYSSASKINDVGQVVGWSVTASSGWEHAFLYTDGQMTNLGTMGGVSSKAVGINNMGIVVGYAYMADGTHAFVFDGNQMHDLNDLIPANSGWSLYSANAVNNVGQIVGFGANSQGEQHAFLLTPVDNAAGVPAISIGGFALLFLTLTVLGIRHPRVR